MRPSFIFFGPALLVACNNDPPQLSQNAKPLLRRAEIAADIPPAVNKPATTNYVVKFIHPEPGTRYAIRVIQPNRGTNYVIERIYVSSGALARENQSSP